MTVPGEKRNGEKKVLTDLGASHTVTWLQQSKEGEPNYLYLVSYVDYPEGTFSRDSTDLISELFAVSVETQVKDLGGEIVYQSDSPYGMYPGIIYRATYNKNDAVIKSRMILMNDRLYILQVYTISSKSLNPEMNRFLESFKARQ
ncbi:MAG: hypothetical protein IPP49_05395 [Saprospiraceae bacterium]|nr:hypothetical protein [Saprospiraceae bacterium]